MELDRWVAAHTTLFSQQIADSGSDDGVGTVWSIDFGFASNGVLIPFVSSGGSAPRGTDGEGESSVQARPYLSPVHVGELEINAESAVLSAGESLRVTLALNRIRALDIRSEADGIDATLHIDLSFVTLVIYRAFVEHTLPRRPNRLRKKRRGEFSTHRDALATLQAEIRRLCPTDTEVFPNRSPLATSSAKVGAEVRASARVRGENPHTASVLDHVAAAATRFGPPALSQEVCGTYEASSFINSDMLPPNREIPTQPSAGLAHARAVEEFIDRLWSLTAHPRSVATLQETIQLYESLERVPGADEIDVLSEELERAISNGSSDQMLYEAALRTVMTGCVSSEAAKK